MKLNPFENTGSQLKRWAIILYWLELIGEFIAGLILLFVGDGKFAWIGAITIFGGLFFTAITTALLYGVGELVDRCCSIDEKLGRFEKKEPIIIQQTESTQKKKKAEPIKTQSTKQENPQSVSRKQRRDDCSTMSSQHPCSICDYNEGDLEDEDFFIDIVCPECGEEISFSRQALTKGKEVQCPLCDAKIKNSNL